MLFGGGHIYSSDDPIQGYKPDAKNPAFHADGDGVAFTRLWNVQGSSANDSVVLISHQWMTDGMTGGSSSQDPLAPGGAGGKGIYLAPLKEMKVGTDGTPRVVYWRGNEALKGGSITLPPLPPPAPPPSPAPPKEVVLVAGCGAQMTSDDAVVAPPGPPKPPTPPGTTIWSVPAVGATGGCHNHTHSVVC